MIRYRFDTTVQEKNVTFPTETKLHLKIIDRCRKIAETEGLVLQRSYRATLRQLRGRWHFGRHKKGRREALKAARQIRIIAGCLVRELRRKLSIGHLAHRVMGGMRADSGSRQEG